MLSEAQRIFIYGKVIDEQYPQISLQQIMIINQRSQVGIFGEADNTFQVQIDANDTLIISATGYARKKICFKDSTGTEFHPIIKLHRLSYNLNEVTVKQKKELKQIDEDIKKLGYEKKDYKLTGVEAWQSPITALYQTFSRKERNKRALAELINNDNRRRIIRDLLTIYSSSDLIRMPESQYDDFIDYLNLDDEALKMMSDYDMAVFIRDRYIVYMSNKKFTE
jgi:hypothetical protein